MTQRKRETFVAIKVENGQRVYVRELGEQRHKLSTEERQVRRAMNKARRIRRTQRLTGNPENGKIQGKKARKAKQRGSS